MSHPTLLRQALTVTLQGLALSQSEPRLGACQGTHSSLFCPVTSPAALGPSPDSLIHTDSLIHSKDSWRTSEIQFKKQDFNRTSSIYIHGAAYTPTRQDRKTLLRGVGEKMTPKTPWQKNVAAAFGGPIWFTR